MIYECSCEDFFVIVVISACDILFQAYLNLVFSVILTLTLVLVEIWY